MNQIKIVAGLTLTLVLAGCQSKPETTSQTEPKASPSAALPTYNQVTFPDGVTPAGDSYIAGKADLNGDGAEEILLLMQGTDYCGSGGCSAYIIDNNNNKLGRMTVTEKPIMLGNRKTNGWQDLVLWRDRKSVV